MVTKATLGIAVSVAIPWVLIVTALGAWGTNASDLVIHLMTMITFLAVGFGLWIDNMI